MGKKRTCYYCGKPATWNHLDAEIPPLPICDEHKTTAVLDALNWRGPFSQTARDALAEREAMGDRSHWYE